MASEHQVSAFGKLLDFWMKKAGTSQRALARTLGVSDGLLYMVRSGRRRSLNERHWPALSEALDVPFEKIRAAALLREETLCETCNGTGFSAAEE